MGITKISGQSLHRGTVAEPLVGGAGEGVFETEHFHTCQSILLKILFNNVVKMLKISQPVTFFPHPPLYQPEARCGNLVMHNTAKQPTNMDSSERVQIYTNKKPNNAQPKADWSRVN